MATAVAEPTAETIPTTTTTAVPAPEASKIFVEPSPQRPIGGRVRWYRVPIPQKELAKLNQRSNFWGFLQTAGYLGLLAVTGTVTYMVAMRIWPLRLPMWWNLLATIPLLWFHGMCWHFLINGFHELIHDSVFKTRGLNKFFLWIYSFLGWYNHIQFWASHTEHHKFTLHQPDDLEVTLPQKFNTKDLLKWELVNYNWAKWAIPSHWRYARGKLPGKWDKQLFENDPVLYRKLKNWSRFVLIGHAIIFAVAMYMHWWALPLVLTVPMMFGGSIHALTNSSQHIGLRDNVPDFRLCCRTIYLNPFLQFIYWHMNYHIEHHMYAAVPCYNLPKLHRAIKHELPYTPTGLRETWTIINGILEKQNQDPNYQFNADLPTAPRFKSDAITKNNGNGNGNGQADAGAEIPKAETDDIVLGVMAKAGAPVHDIGSSVAQEQASTPSTASTAS